MKKLTISLCMVIAWLCSLQAQEAKSYFKSMPDSIVVLLTENNRADCIDFIESHMKAEITNRLDGKSEMTAMSADFINMKMSENSSWQMKLLAINDSTSIICTVSTACAPACDSFVRFYTTEWKQLTQSSFISLPTMHHYLSVPDSTQNSKLIDASKQADMLLQKAELCADDATLTLTFTTPHYMSKDAVEQLSPYLRRSIVYRWNKETATFVMSNEISSAEV